MVGSVELRIPNMSVDSWKAVLSLLYLDDVQHLNVNLFDQLIVRAGALALHIPPLGLS